MRCIRSLHGTAISIPVHDSTATEATLSWNGGSATVSISDGICTISIQIAKMVPEPERPLDHTRCMLTFNGQSWCVDYLYNHSHHMLEAKHRWRQT